MVSSRMISSSAMKLVGVVVVLMLCLAPALAHGQSGEASKTCGPFTEESNRQCPSGRGATCKVEPSGASEGCSGCTRSQDRLRVTCNNGLLFQFNRNSNPTRVVITFNSALVMRINQAAVKFSTLECRTNRRPIDPPIQLTTLPPPNSNSNNPAAISHVQVCYNSVNCNRNGGICGDPKIVGGDGVMFYFHGRKNQDFCLVSDSDLHINAHFIGKRPEGRTRDFTWVQALGFVSGPHTLTIAAKKVAYWDPTIDQLELTYNGKPFALDTPSWESPDAALSLTRIGAQNAVDVVVKDKMGVSLTVVPIGEKENRVHKYGITADDCFAHFDMQFRFYSLSDSVNGVLGQTYQPGFVNPVKRGVAMPIMGGADRFFSSSLLTTDCKMSHYTAAAAAKVRASAMPAFHAASCGSSGADGGIPGVGLTCRR